MAAGAYSSIFIATPLLVQLKEREPEIKAGDARAMRHRSRTTVDRYAARRRRSPRTCRVAGRARRAAEPREDAGADDAERRRPAPSRPAGSRPASVPASTPGVAVGVRQARAAEPQAALASGARSDGRGRSRRRARSTTLIRDVPDFPEPGVVFKDITPLLADHDGVHRGRRGAGRGRPGRDGNVVVDKVVGMEARGFILAAPVALALGAGFVPVRKAGKLPGETHAVSYALEYGEATLEMHHDGIAPGERVLLVDDVLATGGTADATRQLVERVRRRACTRSRCCMELSFLHGRDASATSPLHAPADGLTRRPAPRRLESELVRRSRRG